VHAHNLPLLSRVHALVGAIGLSLRLPAVGTLKEYSKVLEYEYRVKTVVLGTLKGYSILFLTLYLEWHGAYSTVGSGGPTSETKGKNAITHEPKIQIKFRLHN
jgi:hypothetical protein